MSSLSIPFRIRHTISPFLPIPLFARKHASGLDLSYDLKKQGIDPKTIFDIGANVGQSAYKFHTRWPKADIFCFEPVEETFNSLVNNVGGYTQCFQYACSNEKGKDTICIPDISGQSSLEHSRGKNETIQKIKLDNFAKKKKINTIDLLKIDVEGHELEVLQGAESLLSDGRIQSVLAEVGFSSKLHTPIEDVASALEPYGFYLVSLHDQRTNPTSGELKHANCLWARTK
jgi:FkbM family methyltransferase